MATAVQHVVARIRAEYLEMPGLRLTQPQLQRLLGVDPTICASVLDALVDARFLCVKADGRYATIYKKWFGTEPPKP